MYAALHKNNLSIPLALLSKHGNMASPWRNVAAACNQDPKNSWPQHACGRKLNGTTPTARAPLTLYPNYPPCFRNVPAVKFHGALGTLDVLAPALSVCHPCMFCASACKGLSFVLHLLCDEGRRDSIVESIMACELDIPVFRARSLACMLYFVST